ncbi:transcriptional regulator, PaaX family [Geodermatophilus siccatus]|uniref:Transcriptional regulator, PaaX family n=1 Tax=Geodermatophilus siccatus TaxID=1137991 RepID=A0A1G9NEE6_9ACTN|nr:PaaX family transcriptional regulator C-terminal domain-containing protein [Geodermatophilus siccatus]SDL84852.1 transcriptional regulator, PaaX family [Geodermatophilus siccatus]
MAVPGVDAPEDEDREPAGAPRPQSLLLTFFGGYVLGRGVAVSTGSVLEVLGRVGVSEHAVRSTLSRMARRGLLRRVRQGRQVYLGLTPRSREVLRDGETRVWRVGAVNTRWDGAWTLLGFSLPDAQRSQRHELRSRLLWAGFGPLQGGLWVAPSGADVSAVAGDPGLSAHIRVFTARALPPTDVDAMVRDAWDLDAIAARYRGFLERWEVPERRPELPDALAWQLALQTDWLRVIRQDPRLPVQHLPEGWPAERAQRLFLGLHAELDDEARAVVADVLDVVPDDAPARS